MASIKTWWVATTLIAASAVAGAQAQASRPSLPDPADFLPAPRIEPGDVPRACASSGKRRAESDAADAGVRILRSWGMTHFKLPANCFDWDFVIGKWQQTVGHPVTGVATQADADRLKEELAKRRAGFQQSQAQFEAPRLAAQRAEQEAQRKAAEDLPRSIVDFLPPGSNQLDRQCGQAQTRVAERVRLEVQRQIAALPRGSVSSGRTEAIEREVSARAAAVAPQWRELWQGRPELVEWASRHRCDRVLRFAVEYWQETIGVAADALDPQAVARTVELLASADADLKRFNSDQAARLAAEAKASGEAGRARTWVLDDVAGGLALQAATDRMPSALCSAGGASITCSIAAAPCKPERQAASAAQGRISTARLARPLNDTFWSVPSELVFAERDAQAAVKRCEVRYPYTAAANSKLLFAGIGVRSAQLDFGERGLVAMRLTLDGNVEAARRLLTDRYGTPQSQQETRTRDVTVQVGGGSAYVPGAGTVTVAPGLATVPQSYSVTRYVWTRPGVLVEESTGSVSFRFDPKR